MVFGWRRRKTLNELAESFLHDWDDHINDKIDDIKDDIVRNVEICSGDLRKRDAKAYVMKIRAIIFDMEQLVEMVKDVEDKIEYLLNRNTVAIASGASEKERIGRTNVEELRYLLYLIRHDLQDIRQEMESEEIKEIIKENGRLDMVLDSVLELLVRADSISEKG